MAENLFNHKEEHEKCQRYLANKKIITIAKTCIDFFEGRQWAPVAAGTETLPRPVINMIKMVVLNKFSGVMSSRVKLSFIADNDDAPIEDFNNFADYMQREIRQDVYDKKVVKKAAVVGTGCWHYYLDKQAKGKKGKVRGGMRVESIDPFSISVENPEEQDVQKQKWFQIASRYPVDAVREIAEDKYKQNAVADVDEKLAGSEKEGIEYVTVYLRYFKKNGEVFYEKATKNGMLCDPISLTPDISEAMKAVKGIKNYSVNGPEEPAEKIDPAETALPDERENTEPPRDVFSRYPVVLFTWDEMERCMWGIGEVEPLIPNQKSLNFGMAMQLLMSQNQAWGKWIAKEDALRGQEITNEPGQVLTDYSKQEKGLYRAQETGMSSIPMDIIEKLLEMTRIVTGSSEVVTGEVLGSNMSGAAIAALQSQALKPIDEKQKSYWSKKEEQGLIYAEFMKFYYEDEPYSYDQKDPTTGMTSKKNATFSGSVFEGMDFEVVVEAGAASTFSEASDVQVMESLLQVKAIDTETFVRAYPKGMLSNRKQLLDAIEAAKKDQLALMAARLAKQEEQMKQAGEIIQDQQETIDNAVKIIQENKRLKEQLIAMEAEYTEKIKLADKFLAEAIVKGQVTQQDAIMFAKMLARQSQSQKQEGV